VLHKNVSLYLALVSKCFYYYYFSPHGELKCTKKFLMFIGPCIILIAE